MSSNVLSLPGLRANVPAGLLAGLGVLDVLARRRGDLKPRLSWQGELEPTAQLHTDTVVDYDGVAEEVFADVDSWLKSETFWPRQDGERAKDVKLTAEELSTWAQQVGDVATPLDRAAADLHRGLAAEGAMAEKGRSKPTHLHFTAGKQAFISVAHATATRLSSVRLDGAGAIRDVLTGPWPWTWDNGFNWEAGGARLFALGGFDPAGTKKSTVTGVNWLAFLGLAYFPVAEHRGKAVTAGASSGWKSGDFCWPVWQVPLRAQVIRSLTCRGDLTRLTSCELAMLGLTQVMRSPITRSDQGGYGAFSPASVVASAR